MDSARTIAQNPYARYERWLNKERRTARSIYRIISGLTEVLLTPHTSFSVFAWLHFVLMFSAPDLCTVIRRDKRGKYVSEASEMRYLPANLERRLEDRIIACHDTFSLFAICEEGVFWAKTDVCDWWRGNGVIFPPVTNVSVSFKIRNPRQYLVDCAISKYKYTPRETWRDKLEIWKVNEVNEVNVVEVRRKVPMYHDKLALILDKRTTTQQDNGILHWSIAILHEHNRA